MSGEWVRRLRWKKEERVKSERDLTLQLALKMEEMCHEPRNVSRL